MATLVSSATADITEASSKNCVCSPDDDEDAGYVCQLDAATEEKAKRELNEDPKDRLNAVRALRAWLRQQPHIRFQTDTLTLLAFLRTAKFSQLKARQMIEKNATVTTENPIWFKNIDTCEPGLMNAIESGYAILLPKKDKNGCRILLYRFGVTKDGGKVLAVEDEIRCAMVVGSHSSVDENLQVNGFVFIMDMTGLTMKHMTRWKMEDLKKWNNSWQSCMPGRFKAFHYYNAGAIFDAIMALTKPLMSQKFQERIFIHNTLESLYKAVDMDLLPDDYLPDDYSGPSAGSVATIIANFKRQISDPVFRKKTLEQTGDKYGVDQSKRPTYKPVNESFRKLAVD